MATEPHREFARRQHRTLGLYLAVAAWSQGCDCIVVERAPLEKFLGLVRFRGERVKWLQRDLRPWFPHQEVLYTETGGTLSAAYLARVDLVPVWMPVAMTNRRRISRLNENGVRTALLQEAIPSESEMLGRLVGMASGLIAPASRP